MSMGDRIKTEREALGMSQAQLAVKSGVKQQMISKLEAGKAKSTGNLVGIARALNVIPWWLQSGEGKKHPHAPQATPEKPTPPPDVPDISAPQTESLTTLLDRVADQLNQADPSVRDEVTRLMMRYIENPETGARIAKAIELLLSKDAPDDPAAR